MVSITRNVENTFYIERMRISDLNTFSQKIDTHECDDCTYFEPRLRHFRCPGMNLVALDSRIEPDGIDALIVAVTDFAGDKFSDAIVDGSM